MAFTPFGSSFPKSRGGQTRGRNPHQNREEHRLNERIRVPQVRLIDENGGQVGIVDTRKALQMAKDAGLDLMEVSPNSRPPVCKIIDYGKFKYEKKKKEHLAKKKQTVIKVKEIQLRPTTDTHDLDYKIKNARSFLEDGDKVKITMLFRGRQIVQTDTGKGLMLSLFEQLKEVSTIEFHPKMEGRKMIMILAPIARKPAKGAPKAPEKTKKSKESPKD